MFDSDLVCVCESCGFEFVRYVNFVNNITITLSDEEMTKIKVVCLDEFYNFYIHDFFSYV